MHAKALARARDGGYETSKAVEFLFSALLSSNKLDENGSYIMRLGCSKAIVERAGRGRGLALVTPDSPLEESARRRQMRFDVDWMSDEVALSEGVQARRKTRGECNLEETKAWISLKFKKAEETRQDGAHGQAFVDMHPEWAANPELTASQVAGLANDQTSTEAAAD